MSNHDDKEDEMHGIRDNLERMAAEGFLDKTGADEYNLTDDGMDHAIRIMGGKTVVDLSHALLDVLRKHGSAIGEPLPKEFLDSPCLWFSLVQIGKLLDFYKVSEPVLARLTAEGFGKEPRSG